MKGKGKSCSTSHSCHGMDGGDPKCGGHGTGRGKKEHGNGKEKDKEEDEDDEE